jgi:hypothetical protein
MAGVKRFYTEIEGPDFLVDPADPIGPLSSGAIQLREWLSRGLRGTHGVHGLRILGDLVDVEAANAEGVDPDLIVTDNPVESSITLKYVTPAGETIADTAQRDEDSVRVALSKLALRNFRIPLEAQSSRDDVAELEEFIGARPNLTADPLPWIMGNPFMQRLLANGAMPRRLLNYLANERGLFLKVGNYPDQRSHWNSTTNGGLPVFRKADPIHEGTFMYHDLLHFVPIDPTPGSVEFDAAHQAAYVAHRLLSEASTLVLADMIGVGMSGIENEGYDVSKRKIYPVAKSIFEKEPSVGMAELLLANAIFCFSGSASGFRSYGASEEALADYAAKYGSIFRNDFLWNRDNALEMAREQRENPLVRDYFAWLEQNLNAPTIRDFDRNGVIDANGELDPSGLVQSFFNEFAAAMAYEEPADNQKRARLAAQKYLAGQRIVFARYGRDLDPGKKVDVFDDQYGQLVTAGSLEEVDAIVDVANGLVEAYLMRLYRNGIILPHEVELNRFTAPLYPVKFINYEKNKDPNVTFADELNAMLKVTGEKMGELLATRV